jgi:hypothetical protein
MGRKWKWPLATFVAGFVLGSMYQTDVPSAPATQPDPVVHESAAEPRRLTESIPWPVAVDVTKNKSPPAGQSGGASAGTRVNVPSDPRSSYSVVEISPKVDGRVVILTRRSGPSGVSHSRRECDCGANTFRYLGDGATVADALRPKVPTESFVPLVGSGSIGSVSAHVCWFACRFYKF